jgi:antitoxin ParD1/3/4
MAYYANGLTLPGGDSMPTRNVVLTEHQADLVERLVASGRYQNASEVLREGLRLVESREAEDKARLKALRDAARVGIADIEAGRFRSFSSPEAIRERLAALADNAITEGIPGASSK